MKIPDQVYIGMPSGISRPAALTLLLINVFTPGVGTIIAAFLATECRSDTVIVGILQLLTSPLLLLGFIWSIAWSLRLYKQHTVPAHADEESVPLNAPTPDPAQY